ncbi:hypothetical protein lerEdw1_002948 [Lerista edwardsae]|nr:hypothetical protein lerEdw1_002948 [Lerista edwardsae]
MAAKPGELESALQTLVEMFDKYAGKDLVGRRRRAIGRSNFRKLLSCELHHMLTASENRQAADKLIGQLDENSDGKISFEEYWNLIGLIVNPLLQHQLESLK